MIAFINQTWVRIGRYSWVKLIVIKNNIAFGIPAEKIDREMAEQAADNFYLDFVSEEN